MVLVVVVVMLMMIHAERYIISVFFDEPCVYVCVVMIVAQHSSPKSFVRL